MRLRVQSLPGTFGTPLGGGQGLVGRCRLAFLAQHALYMEQKLSPVSSLTSRRTHLFLLFRRQRPSKTQRQSGLRVAKLVDQGSVG
jgi:hypothetical protein